MKDPKEQVVGDFAKQLVADIDNTQTINLNLISQNEGGPVLIDQFVTGKVDIGDLLSGTAETFRDNVLHFVTERLAIPDYEKNKMNTSNADFLDAHHKGLASEVEYLRDTYPFRDISYVGEGYDQSSLKLDPTGTTGTINYKIDYNDVKMILQENITVDPTTKAIQSTSIISKNYFLVAPARPIEPIHHGTELIPTGFTSLMKI